LYFRLGSGKPSNVIVDGGKDSDEEEDETFMVEETAAPQEQEQVNIQTICQEICKWWEEVFFKTSVSRTTCN
jgi:hypothetical protein